jgi:hypothetical protein
MKKGKLVDVERNKRFVVCLGCNHGVAELEGGGGGGKKEKRVYEVFIYLTNDGEVPKFCYSMRPCF